MTSRSEIRDQGRSRSIRVNLMDASHQDGSIAPRTGLARAVIVAIVG